mgnify:CR=1 FL=1
MKGATEWPNAGIYLTTGTDHCTISNNNASNNAKGISLRYSSTNTLTNNTALNNDYCIHLYESSNNTLTNNTVSHLYHSQFGFLLISSSNNIISNNNASSNFYGMQIGDSSNNTISNNDVSNNYYGVLIFNSSDYKIYLNNFINNNDSVYSIDNSNNIWNSTSKITYTYNGTTYENYVGNYWDDYKEKYPSAEEIDSSGIWNTPYSINSDNDSYPLVALFENYFAPTENIFDTGSPATPYPSIMGNHTGTITPNQTITVSKLYTYPCVGTGGHTEYARIWDSTLDVNATWNGYTGDWYNLSFPESFRLYANVEYNYTIRTGSYPQIHHTDALPTATGWINCTQFTDANGKVYYDWIPAIRLYF